MLILGCLIAWPVLWYMWYILRFVKGWQVRAGEVRFIRAWLHAEDERDGRGHHPLSRRSEGLLAGRNEAELAVRYPNGGTPFILLNLDRIAFGSLGWWLSRRHRWLIDAIAHREGVPVFPVPYTPWRRGVGDPNWPEGSTFHLVHRKRRECVFTKTHEGETVYYLSGFDHNERWPGLYFLTQLPRPATSIADARQALKPCSVVLAEQIGRRVYRQGDMFAITTKITTEQIEERGGTTAPNGLLYGTAHIADLVASLPDGTQLARGTLHHKPALIGERRLPDHRPRKLTPRRWHLVAKNTTPMSLPAKKPAVEPATP
jgi:hypothetical protein